jgi:hypothetical protein
MKLLRKLWAAIDKNDINSVLSMLGPDPFNVQSQKFISQYCKTIGLKKFELFCELILSNKLLDTAILGYIMLGHRSYDKNEHETMRRAYKKTIELAEDRVGAQKWLYAAYYYWAKHDQNIETKINCIRLSITKPDYSGFSQSLINSKFKRALAWLITFGGPKDKKIIDIGFKRFHRMMEIGKISKKKYDAFIKSTDYAKWFISDKNP